MKLNILVPDHLNEITLEQYQKFAKLNTKENEGSAFLLHKMIEVFCNLDLKDIATIKYKDVQKITLQLNKVFDKKTELIPTFKLKGIEYGFVPELDEITLGEYIDLDNYLGDWDNMHKAMAVLYRPINFKKNNKYHIEDYKGSNSIMLDMPLDIALGAMVFFWSLNEELLQITLNYLNKEIPNNLTSQQKEALEKSGIGINQSMDLLKGMLPNLIQ
tara:strand:+ start:1361 stop:2008 length:648 start_codon:yes stop_codon:yes gene_type:complete